MCVDSSGKIANMADRLIAEGKMTEMILVMQKCSKRKEARIPEEIIQKYRVIPGGRASGDDKGTGWI